jgi:hypothetical protein
MGLDMYLNAKRFMWHTEDELAETVAKAFPELKGRRVKQVIVEAMYWRKANAIHKWFVDNVQDGNDDCGDYWVSREKLQELCDLIKDALDNRDASMLPTQAGFFFGRTDVDQYYWQDLEHTLTGLNRALEDFPEQWDFEYHSSW